MGKKEKGKEKNKKKRREGGEGEGKMNRQQYCLDPLWHGSVLYPQAVLTSASILKDS